MRYINEILHFREMKIGSTKMLGYLAAEAVAGRLSKTGGKAEQAQVMYRRS